MFNKEFLNRERRLNEALASRMEALAVALRGEALDPRTHRTAEHFHMGGSLRIYCAGRRQGGWDWGGGGTVMLCELVGPLRPCDRTPISLIAVCKWVTITEAVQWAEGWLAEQAAEVAA